MRGRAWKLRPLYSLVISQFVWAESGFLESSSSGDVFQNLMILNTRIGTTTQTEHLPTRYSICPLCREREREGEMAGMGVGGDIEKEKERGGRKKGE